MLQSFGSSRCGPPSPVENAKHFLQLRLPSHLSVLKLRSSKTFGLLELRSSHQTVLMLLPVRQSHFGTSLFGPSHLRAPVAHLIRLPIRSAFPMFLFASIQSPGMRIRTKTIIVKA
jgi:hypothetical protein